VKPREIHLHIDELTLHGFAPGDRYRIAEALSAELARIFTEQGLPPACAQSAAMQRIDAGSIQLARPAAGAIGTQAAQAIYGGVK